MYNCWDTLSEHRYNIAYRVSSEDFSKPRGREIGASSFQIALKFGGRLACQISKLYEHFNLRSRAFETLRDFMMRHLK